MIFSPKFKFCTFLTDSVWFHSNPSNPKYFSWVQFYKNHSKWWKLILTNDWQPLCLACLFLHSYLQTYSLFFETAKNDVQKSWSGWQNKVKQFVYKYVMKILQSNLPNSMSYFTNSTATMLGWYSEWCFIGVLPLRFFANEKWEGIASSPSKVTYFCYNFPGEISVITIIWDVFLRPIFSYFFSTVLWTFFFLKWFF